MSPSGLALGVVVWATGFAPAVVAAAVSVLHTVVEVVGRALFLGGEVEI